MEENPDQSCRNSSTDGSISSDIVGSFHIRNHHYLVIQLESITENFTKSDLNCFSFFSRVGQFEAHGQHFAIIEAQNEQATTKSNIADILTERELQIVKLVAQGHPNKRIARKLHISEWTVSTHIRRVFAKLGVDSRAAMVYQCAFLF
jgi:DNA-binding CsgD family transcriptional regulator